MSDLNDIDQIQFTTGYLGLSDSQDSTYATKQGFVVAVNSDGTGTMLIPPAITQDLSIYLKTAVAATTYATQTSLATVIQSVSTLASAPTAVPTLDSVLGNGSATTKSITMGSLSAGTPSRTSANHTFSSANVSGTGPSKFQVVNIGTSNQLSFLSETYGFAAIAYNIDLTANQATYSAHETGFASLNRFDKATGTHTVFTAPSATAGSTSTLAQVYQLDASGNVTFSGGLTAITGTFSGTLSTAKTLTVPNIATAFQVNATAANYTVLLTDSVISVNNGSTAVTITIPSAASCKGIPFLIKRSPNGSTGYVTIVSAGAANTTSMIETQSGGMLMSIGLSAFGTVGARMQITSNGSQFELTACY